MTTTEFWTSAVAGPNRIRAVAARAEQRGWTGISTVDSQNLASDPYVVLAMAAAATDRLGVMTSVTNVVTRHVAVTASSALTVQNVADGRFVLGIGRGDSALAHVGRAPARVTYFEQYLANLAALLRGDEVAMADLVVDDAVTPPVESLGLADGPTTSSIRWAPRVPPVAIEVAASGPKVIAAAARHADRILFALGADPERIGWAIGHAQQAAEDAGRDPDELHFGAYVSLVCHDDVERARSIGRGTTSLFARFSAMHGSVSAPASDEQAEVFRAIHERYDMNHHARDDGAQTEVLTDGFLEAFAVLGGTQYCVDRLGALADLGITKFNVNGASVAARDGEILEASDRFIEDVAPAVAAR